MPGLQKTLDTHTDDQELHTLEKLTAAERLSPPSLPNLTSEELLANMQIIIGSESERPQEFELPHVFIGGLLRRRLLANIDNVAVVAEVVWPLGAAGVFDPYQPKLVDAPVPMAQKLSWMRVWVFNEHLAMHMGKETKRIEHVDKICQALLLSMGSPKLTDQEPDVVLVWEEIYSGLTVARAVVQREAMTPEQVDHMSKVEF